MATVHLALATSYPEPAQGLQKRRFRFTETNLKALPLARKGAEPVEYQDDQIVGFVCVASATVRTLYVRRRRRGAKRLVWKRLGVVGDKPLAEFRTEAHTISAALATGTDPATTAPKRGALTLGDAFDDYLAAKSGKLAASTVAAYKADFEALAGSWRDRAVASITPQEVARRHQERSSESRSRADGALRVIRAVERYSKASAASRGVVLAIDLLAMVRAGSSWNNVARRATYLDNGRRGAWVAAVRNLPDDKGNTLSGTQRDALLLIAATGLRLREALNLTWAEVDLAKSTLVLAPERMKGGRKHQLPIPRRTKLILKGRRQADPDGAFVFPGPDPESPLDRISRQTFTAIAVDFTPHDLRRTAASWLGANAPAYVVKAILSHADPSKSSDVTAGYVILEPNDLRPWLQQWEDVLYTKRTAKRGAK